VLSQRLLEVTQMRRLVGGDDAVEAENEAPRSSLLRRRSHFGYEGRKLRGIRRRRIMARIMV
jgi:hypothetical protein